MVTLYQGSILDAQVDAIVNPANTHLRHDGGLAAVIARGARDYGKITPITQPHGMHTANEGDRIRAQADAWDVTQRAHPLIPTGGAAWTDAGALPFKAIIHAVGPVWGGGFYHEADLLAMAHGKSIDRALALGFDSLAIPAISCGVFGYPVEEASSIAIYVAAQTSYHYPEFAIQFWLFEDAHMEAYRAALDCHPFAQ